MESGSADSTIGRYVRGQFALIEGQFYQTIGRGQRVRVLKRHFIDLPLFWAGGPYAKKNPAQSPKTKRGLPFQQWAWVDSNHRPHAYQI